MTRWLLTVSLPQGPAPLVTRLIDLAGRRPVAMGGSDITVANFTFETEQEAEAARTSIESAQLGAIYFVHSFYVMLEIPA